MSELRYPNGKEYRDARRIAQRRTGAGRQKRNRWQQDAALPAAGS